MLQGWLQLGNTCRSKLTKELQSSTPFKTLLLRHLYACLPNAFRKYKTYASFGIIPKPGLDIIKKIQVCRRKQSYENLIFKKSYILQYLLREHCTIITLWRTVSNYYLFPTSSMYAFLLWWLISA